MRVAYVTPYSCGRGHAVRGAALVRAAGTIDVRAFGPPTDDAPVEYEGSADWSKRAAAFGADLLLGDIGWFDLEGLRRRAGAAWLLLRWMPVRHTGRPEARVFLEDWQRRISIEPAADGMALVTHRIPPIVVDEPRFTPVDGQALRAGYNAWWEATWFGYRDRVTWYTDGSPERQARIDAGGTMTKNGADVLMEMIRGD
jgi:hypothetical protein